MKQFTTPTPPRTFLAAMVLVASSWATYGIAETNPDDVKVLTRADFDKLIAHPEDVVVVDFRRPDELQSIGGFPVYLSIQLADLEKSLAWIPKDRTVVTVSNHASRGKRGGAALIDAGFEVAGAIGVQDYEAEGGTLTKIAPPPPREETAAPAAAVPTASTAQ